MKWCQLSGLCLGALWLCACAAPAPPPRDILELLVTNEQGLRHYHVQVQPVTGIANSGLQLPVVSPDGRWVAYLAVHDDALASSIDLVTGAGLEAVSLVVMSTDGDANQQVALSRGAAWPTWSPDSRQLAAVSYDRAGMSRIALRGVDDAQTRMLSPGVHRITALRFSHCGSRLAMAGEAVGSANRQIFVFDLEQLKLVPGPSPAPGVSHAAPIWLDEQTLLHFAVHEDGVDLHVWPMDESESHFVGYTAIEPYDVQAVQQALAGLPDPMDPTRRNLAYYEAATDRLVVIDMVVGTAVELPPGTRAAVWVDSTSMMVADDEAMHLHQLGSDGRGRQMLRGTTLPLWAHAQGGVLLLTPGASPWMFNLVQLRVFEATP